MTEPAGQRSEAKTSRNPKNAPEVLLPQEEQEQQEMAQLKAMINGLSEKKSPLPAQPRRPGRHRQRQRKQPRQRSRKLLLNVKKKKAARRCPLPCLRR